MKNENSSKKMIVLFLSLLVSTPNTNVTFLFFEELKRLLGNRSTSDTRYVFRNSSTKFPTFPVDPFERWPVTGHATTTGRTNAQFRTDNFDMLRTSYIAHISTDLRGNISAARPKTNGKVGYAVS